jgi:hypothetical protein
MTASEMVALSKKHTLSEWTAQCAVNPIPVVRAKGVYFWDTDGKRYLDFNSQLMRVNAGHGDPRIVEAIPAQAERLCSHSFSLCTPRLLLDTSRCRHGNLGPWRTLQGIEAINMIRKGRARFVAKPDAIAQTAFTAALFGIAA